ncbi:MAG: PepSY-associated TM helix domain-containing protein [Planctomycetota bacterium]|nr:PepSY-associated TM helix domain-containing protein [Planctomycetota bacterium]
MARSLPFWTRKLHRWGAVFVAVPFLLILVTGMLLQFKKDAAWIQPPTMRGAAETPSVSFETILAAAASVAEANIHGWEDVDRLDVRPGRGIVKVQALSGVEVQVDTATGEVLQSMVRRSDLIESLHDGSWFHERAKLWVLFPVALVLVSLWATGVYLWLLPGMTRRRKARTRD